LCLLHKGSIEFYSGRIESLGNNDDETAEGNTPPASQCYNILSMYVESEKWGQQELGSRLGWEAKYKMKAGNLA
jgi:hypothetical protein